MPTDKIDSPEAVRQLLTLEVALSDMRKAKIVNRTTSGAYDHRQTFEYFGDVAKELREGIAEIDAFLNDLMTRFIAECEIFFTGNDEEPLAEALREIHEERTKFQKSIESILTLEDDDILLLEVFAALRAMLMLVEFFRQKDLVPDLREQFRHRIEGVEMAADPQRLATMVNAAPPGTTEEEGLLREASRIAQIDGNIALFGIRKEEKLVSDGVHPRFAERIADRQSEAIQKFRSLAVGLDANNIHFFREIFASPEAFIDLVIAKEKRPRPGEFLCKKR